jgi:putative transposase
VYTRYNETYKFLPVGETNLGLAKAQEISRTLGIRTCTSGNRRISQEAEKVRRSFKYRLYPCRIQAEKLQSLLDAGRILYNLALEQRRDAWRTRKLSLNYYDQASQLKELRDAFPELSILNYSACQDVLRRLQKSFDGFFRRIKIGQVGFPRFKGKDRFDSITFPAYGDGIKLNGKLRIQNVGLIRIKLHRETQGTIKTVSLKREGLKWYVVFSCDDVPARQFPEATQEIGIDVGLSSFAVLSDGEVIDNPRWYRKTEQALADAQRQRDKKHARRLHEKIKNQRKDFQHKLALRLVRENNLIAVENIGAKELIEKSSTGLSKSIADAAWSQFLNILSHKAEEAGREVVKVKPNGTTSTCSQCGKEKNKRLSERLHVCECGLNISRDLNASLNILRAARALLAA